MTSILPGGRAHEHDALAVRLEQARRTVEGDVHTKQRELEAARRRANELRAPYLEADAVCFRIEADIRELNRLFNHERDELERQLTTLADPRIDEFLKWLDKEFDGLHHKRREWGGLSGVNASTGRRRTVTGSNQAAIVMIAEAIFKARGRALALKLQHVPDVAKALEEIRGSIPSIEDAEAATRQVS